MGLPDSPMFLKNYLKHRSAVPVFVVHTIQSDGFQPIHRSAEILATCKQRFAWSETVDLAPLSAEVIHDWVNTSMGRTTLSASDC